VTVGEPAVELGGVEAHGAAEAVARQAALASLGENPPGGHAEAVGDLFCGEEGRGHPPAPLARASSHSERSLGMGEEVQAT
jgi:hypothetical protein